MISESVLYGKGVFTTIAISDGRPCLLEKHWIRLQKNAAVVSIDISGLRKDCLLDEIEKSVERNKLINGRVRITILDESSSQLWSHEKYGETRFSVITGELRPVHACFSLTISPFPANSRSPLAGIKSCNYLEPIMSLDEAKGRWFHEAVRVNERGFVTSACMANVFWVKGGRLFTPSLTTGCLAGTTREFVLENLDCREVEVGIEALNDAEAIFLTSAGIGVVQVAKFEERQLDRVDHPILHLLPY